MIKLSIVTVFKFGDIAELNRTVVSIRGQKTKPYQHIIIISGLTFSYEEIRKLENEYTIVIVNQDRSLYHAMNIGLKKSTGDAIIFLNGGDTFYNSESVDHINATYQAGRCLTMRAAQYYGDDIYIRPKSTRLHNLIKYPSHQAFIAPLPAARQIEFDENRSISADYYWMKNLINANGIITNSRILCKFSLGGMSNFPTLKTVRLRFRESGFLRSLLEIIKLIVRLSLGDKTYYRVLLGRKCDKP